MGQQLDLLLKEFRAAIKNQKKCRKYNQQSISSFFKKSNNRASTNSSDPNKPTDDPSIMSNIQSRSVGANSGSILEDLYKFLGLSPAAASNVQKSLKIDVELLQSKESMSLLNRYRLNKAEHSSRAAWIQKKGIFYSEINYVKTQLSEFKQSFTELAELCDRQKNMEIASNLPMDEMGPFLEGKSREANKVAKETFLKLNSEIFKAKLRSVNHTFRKRIAQFESSNIQDLEFKCYMADKSWEECLSSLHDNLPTLMEILI